MPMHCPYPLQRLSARPTKFWHIQMTGSISRAGVPRVQMVTSERHVNVNGTSMWTATQGNGHPAVLCHGGPGVYDYLEPVAAMIDSVATVHRYDQRGCGRTQDLGPYDIDTFVADLDALRTCWGHATWTVIGHSWGATLALLYTTQYPEHTDRLVYISGTGIDPDWHREYRRNREAKLSPVDRERFRLLNLLRSNSAGEELDRINEERSALLEKTELFDSTRLDEVPQFDRFPVNYALNAALNEEMRHVEEMGTLAAQVAGIKVPALVLDGEGDPRPRWARAQIARLIPGGLHVTIAGAGHEPWLEQPEATGRALLNFLKETA